MPQKKDPDLFQFFRKVGAGRLDVIEVLYHSLRHSWVSPKMIQEALMRKGLGEWPLDKIDRAVQELVEMGFAVRNDTNGCYQLTSVMWDAIEDLNAVLRRRLASPQKK